MLTLYSDPVSHLARACLLFLRANDVKFKEEIVRLFKAEQKNHPALPTETLPTLVYEDLDGSKQTICQSTTILRYLGANFAKDNSWYSRPDLRYKIDEYFDFFQGNQNPALLKAIHNKLLYKVRLQKPEPDLKLVQEGTDDFFKHQQFVMAYYIKGREFMGGDQICVGDLLVASTLEQAKLFAQERVEQEYGDYISKVSSQLEGYDELLKDVVAMPRTLKEMGAL